MASRTGRHSEKLGITDWLAGQVALRGVEVRTNTYVDAADVLAQWPDVLVVGSGGLPNSRVCRRESELVLSNWDVISGAPTPGQQVLLFDDHGEEQAIPVGVVTVLPASNSSSHVSAQPNRWESRFYCVAPAY